MLTISSGDDTPQLSTSQLNASQLSTSQLNASQLKRSLERSLIGLQGNDSIADRLSSMGNSTTVPTGAKRDPLQKNWGLIRRLQRTTLMAKQNAHMARSATPSDGLVALQQAAKWGEVQKTRMGWQRGGAIAPLPHESLGYAAPLSPLRERDETILTELFQRNDMLTIEADIGHCLLKLLPEPCWEENPLELLAEFLQTGEK